MGLIWLSVSCLTLAVKLTFILLQKTAKKWVIWLYHFPANLYTLLTTGSHCLSNMMHAHCLSQLLFSLPPELQLLQSQTPSSLWRVRWHSGVFEQEKNFLSWRNARMLDGSQWKLVFSECCTHRGTPVPFIIPQDTVRMDLWCFTLCFYNVRTCTHLSSKWIVLPHKMPKPLNS